MGKYISNIFLKQYATIYFHMEKDEQVHMALIYSRLLLEIDRVKQEC